MIWHLLILTYAISLATGLLSWGEYSLCVVPPYPAHGTYVLPYDAILKLDLTPGSVYFIVYIEVACDDGFIARGKKKVLCKFGHWPNELAECVRYCTLPSNDRVEYHCLDAGKSTKPCNSVVLAGTMVQPKCLNSGLKNTKAIMNCMDNGNWDVVEDCKIDMCVLPSHPSVEYTCFTYSDFYRTFKRPCRNEEYPGTIAIPKCRETNYYSFSRPMYCQYEGYWDHIATCYPECGRVTPDGQPNVINGTRAKHGELPWHAGIYRKTSIPYTQICGGSLVSTRAVISAAHCFWDDVKKLRNAELYAVALGKIYRPWHNTNDADTNAQYFDVLKIHVPNRFRGSANNFQDDIAIIVLNTEVVFTTFIRPVCVDFDFRLKARQLEVGKIGKVAGWGLTEPNGNYSQLLQVAELPYTSFSQCFDEFPDEFQEFITNDKFCAGTLNGTTLCQGDSGAGLTFPEYDKGVLRYYLRGIVSTKPRDKNICRPNVRSTFTDISHHKEFIKEFVNF